MMNRLTALQQKRREQEAELRATEHQIAAYENLERYEMSVSDLHGEIEHRERELGEMKARFAEQASKLQQAKDALMQGNGGEMVEALTEVAAHPVIAPSGSSTTAFGVGGESNMQSLTITGYPQDPPGYTPTSPLLIPTNTGNPPDPFGYTPPPPLVTPHNRLQQLQNKCKCITEIDGKLYEVFCKICNANAPRDPVGANPYFNGVPGVMLHIGSSHRATVAPEDRENHVECRELREGEADKILQGESIIEVRKRSGERERRGTREATAPATVPSPDKPPQDEKDVSKERSFKRKHGEPDDESSDDYVPDAVSAGNKRRR